MDDRAAVLERVAELVGDRFGWLTEIGTGVASLGADEVLGDKGIACAGDQLCNCCCAACRVGRSALSPRSFRSS